MQGTLVIRGTRYAWNIENKGDQACLERWSHWGPGMCGTLVTDWLKLCAMKKWIFWSNQIGPKVYGVRRIRVLKFSNVPGMSSPHRKAFQACLVPNVTNVPGIPSPQFYQSSTHTWSPMWSTFQPCLVPFIFDVPGIPGPHYDQCSLHS